MLQLGLKKDRIEQVKEFPCHYEVGVSLDITIKLFHLFSKLFISYPRPSSTKTDSSYKKVVKTLKNLRKR